MDFRDDVQVLETTADFRDVWADLETTVWILETTVQVLETTADFSDVCADLETTVRILETTVTVRIYCRVDPLALETRFFLAFI